MRRFDQTLCPVMVLGVWIKVLCELGPGPVHHCVMVTCAIDLRLV